MTGNNSQEKTDGSVTPGRPVQASWWQQFWWRYSPNWELPLSSVGSWLLHIGVVLLAWVAAMTLMNRLHEPPRLDVVALGDGFGAGRAGGGDGQPPGDPGDTGATAEFQPLVQDSPPTRADEKLELPDVPSVETTKPRVKSISDMARDRDSERQMEATDAALRDAGDALRRILAENQNRGQGQGGSGGGAGTGKGVGLGDAAGPGTGRGGLDANSTPGRQARWIITYPTIAQGEYERLLDFFHIELAYLDSDRRTMKYLSNVAGTGRKHNGDATNEERMFWYWMGQNRLSDLDDAIMRKHGFTPTSEVVQLYSKELEQRLATLERDYLKNQFKSTQVERIAQTNFRITSSGSDRWRVEVTSLVLR